MGSNDEVLVVGAGPVGLTMAIALRRLGVHVRVVDKAPGTNREPRADVLFPRAGEVLGSIGVGERLRDSSYQMQGADIYGNGRRIGSFRVGQLSSQFPRAMTIEQHDIEKLLAEELAQWGVLVEWQTEATRMEVHEDRVDMTLRMAGGVEEQTTAAWVVACDGSRSQIRDWLGIPFEGQRRRNMQVVQGNVVPSWHLPDHPGQGYFFLAPYRSVIAFPTPAGGYRIFCVRDDPDPQLTDPPTLDELRALVAGAAGIPDLRLELTEPVWLSRSRFSDRIATTLRRGRVLLAGDAAHAWAPIGGHGMNVGILGAHNLAWKLAAVHRGHATDALLDSYSTEQRVLARGVIRDMKFNIMEALLPALPNRLRCAALKAALPSQRFQQRGEWVMSDFGRNHRASPLTWRHSRRPARGPRAGYRVPDVAVVGASEVADRTSIAGPSQATAVREDQRSAVAPEGGPPDVLSIAPQAARLHQLLSYDRWTLLLSADHVEAATLLALRNACAACPAPVQLLTVSAQHPDATEELGRTDEYKLIRPDGYVALVAQLERVDLLSDYLGMFFAP
jgi:2-polyprenyl-6-methoxyphenol hydroxylase-like FAD-dependent oxidoreductase